MAKVFVLGSLSTGVLIVKTDPVRVAHIDQAAIQAKVGQPNYGKTYEEVFGQVVAGAKRLVNTGTGSPSIPDNDASYGAIGALVAGGVTVSDSDFCFVGEMDNAEFAARRLRSMPIVKAIMAVGETGVPSTLPVTEAKLDD